MSRCVSRGRERIDFSIDSDGLHAVTEDEDA
jgi:hypothetical protein